MTDRPWRIAQRADNGALRLTLPDLYKFPTGREAQVLVDRYLKRWPELGWRAVRVGDGERIVEIRGLP